MTPGPGRASATVALLAAVLAACGSPGADRADAGPDARIVLEDAGDATDAGVRDGAPPPDASLEDPPRWFDDARVHAHTRLWKVLAGSPEFAFAARGFAEMGVPVYSRHVKTGSEDPWWPSAVPVVDGVPALAGEPDLVTAMADSAHASGMRIVGYYWHVADERMAELHPEWVCEDAGGAPADSGRGLHLDPTGPYGEVVQTRLSELLERGFDGVYLDLHHLPPGGCYGTSVEDAWRGATGEGAPRTPGTDPHAAYLAFSAERAAETLRGWRRSLRAAHPEAAIIASASELAALTSPHASAALLGGADAAKTELHLALDPEADLGVFAGGELEPPPPAARMAFGWALLRDGASGRPPHVWAPGLPSLEHALGFVAAVTAWGGVANLDVDDAQVLDDVGGSPHKTERDVLLEAGAFGARVGEVLGGSRPIPFAAVHFPQGARDARGADHGRAWREVLWPAVGAFDALLRERVPVGVVTDGQLAGALPGGLELLVLPAPAELDAAQRGAIDSFRAAGGTVIELSADLAWHDPATRDEARAALLDEAAATLTRAPVRAVGGPAHLHAVPFDRPDGARVVALVNGIDWVQTHGTSSALDPAEVVAAPAPAEGVRLELRGEPPTAAREALGGTELAITDAGDGSAVEVPAFEHLALVVLR